MVVDDVVDEVIVLELVDDEVVVGSSLPLSEATTASAAPRPRTAATRITIATLAPVLIPPPDGGSPYPPWGGSPRGGTSILRVGSSCIGGQSTKAIGAQRRRIRIAGTPSAASTTIRPLIFDSPIRRSWKTIGTSTTLRPARIAR